LEDVAIGLEHNASNVTQCLRDDINVGCVNCVLMKEQLCNALMDLKLLNSFYIPGPYEFVMVAAATDAAGRPAPSGKRM
jgi:hypothetical protein